MIAPSVASHACSSMVPPLMPSDTSTSAWAWSLGQENGTGRKTGQVRLLGLGSLRRRSGRAAAWAKGVFESQVRRGAFCPRRAAEWSAAAHAGANRINLRPGLRPVHQTEPVTRLAHRPGRKQAALIIIAAAANPQARPRPIFGAANQIGPQRVALDVACDDEKVVIALDGEGLVATLVEVAAAGGGGGGRARAGGGVGGCMNGERSSSPRGRSSICQWFGMRQQVSRRTPGWRSRQRARMPTKAR